MFHNLSCLPNISLIRAWYNERGMWHARPKRVTTGTKEMHPLRKTYAQMGGHGLDPFGSEYEQTAGSCEYGRALHIPQNALLS